jgi:hypothetical protein
MRIRTAILAGGFGLATVGGAMGGPIAMPDQVATAAAVTSEPIQLAHHKPGHASKGKGSHKGWRIGKGRIKGKHKGW